MDWSHLLLSPRRRVSRLGRQSATPADAHEVGLTPREALLLSRSPTKSPIELNFPDFNGDRDYTPHLAMSSYWVRLFRNEPAAYDNIRPVVLKDAIEISDTLTERYYARRSSSRSNPAADHTVPLNQAIEATQAAVELSGDSSNAKLLLRLSHLLLNRAENSADREASLQNMKYALELLPDDDPDRPQELYTYGSLLKDRFRSLLELSDLSSAQQALRTAVVLTPTNDPNKAERLRELGSSCFLCFVYYGDLAYLDESVSVHRHAVELAPQGDDGEEEQCLEDLAEVLMRRFVRLGSIGDIEEAIQVYQRRLDMTPHDDLACRAGCFIELGSSWLYRFTRSGERQDLDNAISAQRQAMGLIPESRDPKIVFPLLTTLGDSLRYRFLHFGNPADIDDSVSMYSKAVLLQQNDDSLKSDSPELHVDLSQSLMARFAFFGQLKDIEDAIRVYDERLLRQIEAVPLGYDRAAVLSSVGACLQVRFELFGECHDIQCAVSVHRRAVELMPDDHPGKMAVMNKFATSLRVFAIHDSSDPEKLEESISILEYVIERTPDNHPDKATWLNNLGISLHTRYLSAWNKYRLDNDLDKSILIHQRASDLLEDTHHAKREVLHDLGQTLALRWDDKRDTEDFMKANRAYREAIRLTPDTHPKKPKLMFNLGLLFIRHGPPYDGYDFNTVVDSIMTATQFALEVPSERLKYAEVCAEYVSDINKERYCTPETNMAVHRRLIDILQTEAVWLGHGVDRRYRESAKLQGLVNGAVAVAVSLQAIDQAVEWLEAGRTLIWSQLLSLRAPIDAELWRYHPSVARDLLQHMQMLQQSGSYASYMTGCHHDLSLSGLDLSDIITNPTSLHRYQVIMYQSTLSTIRQHKRFENFMRPQKIENLRIPSYGFIDGPVIFINVHDTRCDAIAVHPGDTPRFQVIHLPAFTERLAKGLKLKWTKHLRDCHVRERALAPAHIRAGLTRAGDFSIVMEELWAKVVGPILKVLGYLTRYQKPKEGERLPHVTWCPTGPLSQLPLHVAGIYSDPKGPRVYDFIVSSYTPDLASIHRGSMKASAFKRGLTMPSALIVTQPETPGQSPLPGTHKERACLQHTLNLAQIRSEVLDHKDATVANVKRAISQHPWVHLACHGSQHANDPTSSAFLLYDNPLSLSRLMQTMAENAELAFLSACQTATGDDQNPEESAHLAAGMLAVGFSGVVGTMWSIGDADAPVVVEAFYQKLIELRNANLVMEGETGAAYALHEAVRVLREKVGETEFIKWAPFVHFGV